MKRETNDLEYLIMVTSHSEWDMWWGDNTAVSMQWVLLPNVNVKGSHWSIPSGTRERGNRFRTAKLRKSRLPFLFSSPGWCCTKKPTLECHESRSELYSPDRSNLSSMYHRNKSMGSRRKKRTVRRRKKRKRERKGKRKKKKKRKRWGRNRFIASLDDPLLFFEIESYEKNYDFVWMPITVDAL